MNPQFRHLYPLYFSIFLVVPIFYYKVLTDFINKFSKPYLIFILIAIITFSVNIPIYGKKINLEFYPEDIQFIDQVLNKYNLDHGYAFWGYGNRLVFLSRRKLTIVPYLYKTPLHWGTNKKWIQKAPQFIINLNPKDLGFMQYKTIKKDNMYIHIL